MPARPPPGGADLFPIAGVRGLQEAGSRTFDLLPALPPVRAAPGPPRDEGGVGPGGFRRALYQHPKKPHLTIDLWLWDKTGIRQYSI